MNLEELLSQYDACKLECDGLTRVLHTVLARSKRLHDVWAGRLIDTRTSRVCQPHFWITLYDGRIVDYRARMWLGNEASIPHGIFRPEDYCRVQYKGKQIEMEVLTDQLFNILTGF